MTHATEEDCRTCPQIVTSISYKDFLLSHHVFFLQLGKAAAGLVSGRQKVKLALEKFDKVTCRVSKAHE